MHPFISLRQGLVLLALGLFCGAASAQTPPHEPGAICFTPKFWCWVNPPGKAGRPCTCPSPYGRIRGRLG